VRALDGTRYAYDATNRLVEEVTPDGETITTAYWADGARKQLSSVAEPGEAAQSTTFYWDGGTLVNETHAGSAEASERGTSSYLVGQIRHARTTVDESGHRATRYSSTDRHGNVTALTDEAGAQTLQYAYSDYGVTTTTRADGSVVDDEPWVGQLGYSPFQYANEQTDGGQRQYLRARMLDLETARFLTKDSAARQNLFNFADLNPITNVDPSGREPDKDLLYALGGWALSVIGLALSPFSGGSSLVVAGAIIAATIDTTIATMTIVDQYVADFIPDEWTERLAYTAAAVGGASFVMSAGAASWAKFGRGAKGAARAAGPVAPHQVEPWSPPTKGGAGSRNASIGTPPAGTGTTLSRDLIERQQTVFERPLIRRNTTREEFHMEQDRSRSNSVSTGSDAETGWTAPDESRSRSGSMSDTLPGNQSEVPTAPVSETGQPVSGQDNQTITSHLAPVQEIQFQPKAPEAPLQRQPQFDATEATKSTGSLKTEREVVIKDTKTGQTTTKRVRVQRGKIHDPVDDKY
jgi:RHS repeat-associated protein